MLTYVKESDTNVYPTNVSILLFALHKFSINYWDQFEFQIVNLVIIAGCYTFSEGYKRIKDRISLESNT